MKKYEKEVLMKFFNKNTLLGIFCSAILMGMVSVSAQSFEEDGDSNSEFDAGEAFNSKAIDVDGTFSYREQMDQERKRNREERDERREMNRLKREENLARLQDRQTNLIEREQARNEQRIQTKMGSIRLQNEKQLLKKLFNNEREEEMGENFQTTQASPPTAVPMVPVQIVAQTPQEPKKEDFSTAAMGDIGISFNSSHFDGKNVDMNSNTGFSLSINRQISQYLSLGFSGGITTMGILVKDYAPTPTALESVDTDYQRFHAELSGKTFFAANSYLRPYLQVGASYSRVSLSLDEEQIQQFKKYPYRYRYTRNRYRRDKDEVNTEKISRYIVSASTQLGVAFMFSQNLGLDLSAGYRHNFTAPFKDVALGQDSDRGKEVLTHLGRKLEKSGEISLNAGFTLRF